MKGRGRVVGWKINERKPALGKKKQKNKKKKGPLLPRGWFFGLFFLFPFWGSSYT